MLQKKRAGWQVIVSGVVIKLFNRCLEIKAHLDAQEKEINNLEKEKQTLSQKYSTDPEIIK